MWPYNESENHWLDDEKSEPEIITPEVMRRYISDAERQRAEHVAEHIVALMNWISRSFRAARKALARLAGKTADTPPTAGKIQTH